MNRLFLITLFIFHFPFSILHGFAQDTLPTPLSSSGPPSESVLSPALTTQDSSLSQEIAQEILDPDAAFIFSTSLETPTLLVAHWEIATGYYLYKDKFSFTLQDGGLLDKPQFPVGVIKEDIKYGRVEVYEREVTVKLPLTETQGGKQVTLVANYQGCAEDKFCYPPMTKTTQVALSGDVATTAASPSPLVTNSESVAPPLVEVKKGENASSSMTNWPSGDDVDNFLKDEEAFVFSVESPADRQRLILRWNLAEGYYLYRDKFKFTLASGGQLGTPQFPTGTFRKDPLFGNVEIYLQSPLSIPVPLDAQGRETVTLNVEYQGCALAGLCYPPTHKSVDIVVGKGVVESEEDRIARLFANTSVWYMIMVFFGFGLLLSLTPCVYPMIPILSSIIVGQGWHISTSKAFFMSLVYVLATSLTYAVAGVLTGLLGSNLQAIFQNPWILGSFALIFVALAFSMFGFYELQLPSGLQTKLSQISSQQRGGTLTGVAIMGVLSALIVGPCVAAPLAGALIYIGQTGNALLGGLALFAMGMGMGVPLLIIGTSAGHFLPRKGQWMEVVQAVFGVLLLAVAIWMIARFLPSQVTMLLWASLLIISAVYMGALDNLSAGVSGWRKLWKGIGILFMVYGILLMVGAARGNFNLLQPLETLGISGTPTATPTPLTVPFKPIKGVTELEREIATAQAQGKPVLLDFYADWCISCKEMEQFTLTETGVQKLLANFVLLRADVTANDDQDKALYKQFGIYGPPAILFFSKTGQEQRAYRVVGFMPADTFRKQLDLVLREGA